MLRFLILIAGLVFFNGFSAQSIQLVKKKLAPVIRFTKILIALEQIESAGVFDVNNDFKADLVSCGFWYEGPGFKTKHSIGEVERVGEYCDDFSIIRQDVNGDGTGMREHCSTLISGASRGRIPYTGA